MGEIAGHSKVVNSVSIRQQRPFRAVTASDDMTVVFYHGVPFKYNKTIRDHTRFVHAIQFSPNGDHFASVGADGKVKRKFPFHVQSQCSLFTCRLRFSCTMVKQVTKLTS